MALQIVSVCHRFKQQQVLHDVSLQVNSGDCYGLLGHNGAGKTTILRIALGLLQPSSGSVVMDRFNIRDFPREARSRAGGLIEQPHFNEAWNGLKNLCVLARLQGLDRQQALKEAKRLLTLVGLDRYEGVMGRKKVRAFSQGMKQRLGIAQALMGHPSYVLLDEPMNGLDPQAIVDLRALIRGLIKEGIAVVISSHQLAEISGMCNRIAILRNGRLLVEDTIERLLQTDKKLYRLSLATEPSAAIAFFNALNMDHTLEDHNKQTHESTFLVDLSCIKPAQLSHDLFKEGMDILALTPCDPSLEEVYLRMEAMADSRQTSSPPSQSAQNDAERPHDHRAPKRAFLRGMQYEWTRFWSGFKIASLFLLPAIFACLSIANMHREAMANAERVGEDVFSTTQITAFDGIGKGLKVGLPILMVLVAGLASQSLAGEYTKGTLRYLLLRPINRVQISLSKFSTLVLVCLVSYALLVAASVCMSAAYFDFTDLAELLPNGKLFPLVEKEAMLGYLWPTLWAPILPLMAYTALGFALGSWIKNNVGALTCTLGAMLVMDLGRAFMPSDTSIGYLLAAHLPSPFGGHSFLQFYCHSVQGVSNTSNPYAYLSVTVPLIWLGVMTALGVVALQRKAG